MSFEQYYAHLLDGKLREPLFHIMGSAGFNPAGYCANYYPDLESGDFGLRFGLALRERSTNEMSI
jgi:hypothetical protein